MSCRGQHVVLRRSRRFEEGPIWLDSNEAFGASFPSQQKLSSLRAIFPSVVERPLEPLSPPVHLSRLPSNLTPNVCPAASMAGDCTRLCRSSVDADPWHHRMYLPTTAAMLTFLASAALARRSSRAFALVLAFLRSVSGWRTSFCEGTEVLWVATILKR